MMLPAVYQAQVVSVLQMMLLAVVPQLMLPSVVVLRPLMMVRRI